MKKILVTGDRGYIGAVLVQNLLKNKYEVIGIDTEYFKKNISKLVSSRNYKKINKDIRNISKNDFSDIETVIHLAALSNDPIGELDKKLTSEINFLTTVKLAKLAKKSGVRRFIFSSSCSIYGKTEQSIVSEKSKVNPLTEYARSKIKSERELLKLADKNFCVTIMRNSTVYGFSPKFRDDLVVNNFIANGISTKKIILKSDGTAWRPLIDVRDLSRAFLMYVEANERLINGKVFNVGFDDGNYQIKDVLKIVKNNLKDCEIVFEWGNNKDLRSYKVSFENFSNLFPDFKKEWDMEKSSKDMIKNLKNKYSKNDLRKGNYSRIEVLKKLTDSKKLNKSLRWI